METTTKILDVFIVKNQEYITPHYIRVTFNIPERLVEPLKSVMEGSNNKIFIPPNGTHIINFPDKHHKHLVAESVPYVRTYTTRKIDLLKKELKIDFVLHTNYGPGCNWATNAKIGDALGIGLKQNLKPLIPQAKNYILIGDHTAVPVISTILEQLPEGVNAEVVLEVPGVADELNLISSADIQISWLHNPNPEDGSPIYETAKDTLKSKDENDTYVYVAAEHSTVNKFKNFLKNDLSWDNSNFKIIEYWKSDN